MKDNALIALMRTQLLAGLTVRGITAEVVQNFQPTQQGRPNDPAVLYHKIADHRYGSPRRDEKWDTVNLVMTQTTTEIIESTFQIGAVTNQDPANDTELTAEDIAKVAASVMQSVDFRNGLYAQGVQVLRITDIRTMRVQNDRGQFEANPSFDITMLHKDVVTQTIPGIERINSGIHGI